jgi:hypothetical protein
MFRRSCGRDAAQVSIFESVAVAFEGDDFGVVLVAAVCPRAASGARSQRVGCGSYRMVSGSCIRCGWHHPSYVAPSPRQLTEGELAYDWRSLVRSARTSPR